MKKKLMIFFHGMGVSKDSRIYQKVLEGLQNEKGYEIYAFNALFPYGKGYKWFQKDDWNGENKEFEKSVAFIKSKVDKKLEKEGLSWKDVTLCGHSQGGFLAIYLGLLYGAKEVISICGVFFNGLPHLEKPKTKHPIMWIAAGEDEYFTPEDKVSYKILQKMGCNVEVITKKGMTHNRFDLSLLNDIKEQ